MAWVEDELTRITAPEYLSGLAHADLSQLRVMRDECERVEVVLSFGRRMTEGRMDLIRAALDRSADVSGGADDLLREESYSLEELAAIMASGPARPPGPGRIPKPFAPDFSPDFETSYIMDELNEVVSEGQLVHLQDLDPKELSGNLARLATIESRLSGQRRMLHGILDAIEAEVARRYKDGLATVDSLVNERRGRVTG